MVSLKKKNVLRNFLIFFVCLFFFPALANLRGTDIQNFSPTSSGLDFVTVHSARTLKPYELNFGMFFDYVTNSLSYSKLSNILNGQEIGDTKNSIFYSNIQFGFGILPGWDLGLNFNSTTSQQISGEPNFLFFYDVKGLNDIHINSKIRFFEKENFRFAFVGSLDFQRIKINPFSGNEPGPVFNMEAVGDFRMSPDLLFAVNLGYRLRNKGSIVSNSGVVPMSDQFIYSSAISYKTDAEGSAVIGEIYGGFPIEETTIPTDRETNALELLVGYRFNGFENFRLHGGLGTGVYKGLGSPDFRVYLGLSWRTDQIAKAVGFKKAGELLEPVSLPKEKEDKDTGLSIKKEVDKELPEEMNKNPREPIEQEKSLKENQQFIEGIEEPGTNFLPVEKTQDKEPESGFEPSGTENSSPELYEDY